MPLPRYSTVEIRNGTFIPLALDDVIIPALLVKVRIFLRLPH